MIDQDLHTLARKWVAKANHPMRSKTPEVRQALLQCAADLEAVLLLTREPSQEPVLEAVPDIRCTASSWRGASKRHPYGPGDYNRCVMEGPHAEHIDGFGNVWVIPGKIIRNETKTERP